MRRGVGHRIGNWCCKLIALMCLVGIIAHGLIH